MRILLVAHAFPPKSTGGAETYADAHACGLVARGHEVTVIAREADASAAEYASRIEHRDGLSVVWINNTFRETHSFVETYANPAIDAAAERIIERVQPNVAHVHHLTCLSTGIVSLLRMRGIPVVFTLHDYWLLCNRGQFLDLEYRPCERPAGACRRCVGPGSNLGPQAFRAARAARAVEDRLPRRPARWWRRAVGHAARVASMKGSARSASPETLRSAHMRTVMSQVSRFLAPSQALMARFVAAGLAADRIEFWPCGHDPRPFQEAVGKFRPTSQPLRVGFLGSLMVSKAPHLIFEAVAGLRPGEATVDLYGAYTPYHGDDSYRARIEPWLQTVNVRWHGPIAHGAVPKALTSLDVLVVPSIWPENSPLVIREALLAGVPVVASRIGGIPEAIEDGINGVLFAPGDPTALRQALRRLIDEPAFLDRLRRGARESVVRTLNDDLQCAERLYTSLRPACPEGLAAVVLHFGNPDETRLAVGALLASRRPLDLLVVVDNDPDRRCRTALHDLDDRIRYIPSSANVGFSGGVNVGIREALARGAARILLVNNDVIVPPDAIARLEQTLVQDTRLGAVGPVVLSRADPARITSMGISYSPTTGRMRHLGFGTSMVDLVRNGCPVRRVDGLSGCALLLSRTALEVTGFFDEAYFFGFEDLDWCLRAKRAGFESAVALTALVHHEGGRSIGARSSQLLYFAARNHLRLASVGARPGQGGVAFRSAAVIALNVAHALRTGYDPLYARLGAVARGVRDHLAGRYGAR